MGLSLAAITSCSSGKPSSDASVSMVNVLVDPSAYRGDRVILHGYMRRSGGFVRVYLSKEDALMSNNAAALVVSEISSAGAFSVSNDCMPGFGKVVGTVGEIDGLRILGISVVESVVGFDLTSRPPKLTRCGPFSNLSARESSSR